MEFRTTLYHLVVSSSCVSWVKCTFESNGAVEPHEDWKGDILGLGQCSNTVSEFSTEDSNLLVLKLSFCLYDSNLRGIGPKGWQLHRDIPQRDWILGSRSLIHWYSWKRKRNGLKSPETLLWCRFEKRWDLIRTTIGYISERNFPWQNHQKCSDSIFWQEKKQNCMCILISK